MTVIEAIILGLIQGLTEFIPVSSSGHLLLAGEALQTGDNLLFDVMLHVGTLFALVVYFRKDIFRLARSFFSRNTDGRLARLIVIATVPAAVTGLLLGGVIDEWLRSPIVVAASLSIVGALMLVADQIATRKDIPFTRKNTLTVGLAQAIALIPGVSRSGITIVAGLFSGFSRRQAARFSFLLAIPIIAGSALGVVVSNNGETRVENGALIAGIIVSFLSGLLAIKILLGVIERYGLKYFAYYRFLLALAVILFLL